MHELLCSAVLMLAWGGRALAAENFPPPEFTIPYRFPETATPGPRPDVLAYVDVTVLVVAMGIAAYLVLRKRSRQELVILVVFSLLYFGFYRRGCICAVGSIQNVALAAADPRYGLHFTVAALFVLPLVFALFFGRVFCAAVCPLGVAQEVVLLRPVRVPGWLDETLRMVPYVYLGAAVLFAATGSAFIICEYDPFVLFYRLGGSTKMLVVGIVVLLTATVVGRPYCRYLCPYSVLLRWLGSLARWRVSISPAECVNCHLCAGACPYGAIRAPSPEGFGAARAVARRGLLMALGLSVILAVVTGALGWLSSPMLARVHPEVRLAGRIWLEEQGRVTGQTEASEAFALQATPSVELYREAAAIRHRFAIGAWLFGAWLGLVVGGRLVILAIRRRRSEYQADPAACVACARCFAACPVGTAREAKLLGERSAAS